MIHDNKTEMSKVTEITLAFWIIKITATTLGETAGDAFSMSMKLGYALSTVIFFSHFVAVLTAQIKSHSFNRFLYWALIIATTTVGTTLADLTDRSLGVGYIGGTLILLTLLIAALLLWRWTIGTISFEHITSSRCEFFYWVTILLSSTLGTALGDLFSDGSGLSYGGNALIFAAALCILALVYFVGRTSRTLLFWTAFILTRPLGAVVGDFLTKPKDNGGLDLSRISSSLILLLFMTVFILVTSRKEKISPLL